MPLAHALTTWAHLRPYLDRDGIDRTHCEELIDAATVEFEKCTGKPLIIRTFAEDSEASIAPGCLGGAPTIWLEHRPVVSVTSISDGTETIPPTSYVVHKARGGLQYVGGRWPAPTLGSLWTVTFTAGFFADVAAVDENVRRACHQQVSYWLNLPREANISVSGQAGTTTHRLPGWGEDESPLLPEVRAALVKYSGQEA